MEEKKEILSQKKACKWAIVANAGILAVFIYVTVNYWLLGTDGLERSQKQITLGVGVALILLDVLTAFALRAFTKGNKLTKIYFMLLCVFSFPFAMAKAEVGFLFMVFFIVALFINVSCYGKAHPKES